MKFYLNGTGPDLQTATFTKVKEHLVLKIQIEFVNESDVAEPICNVAILDLSKEILIKKISIEDELRRVESENESFKAMRNIKIENNAKR